MVQSIFQSQILKLHFKMQAKKVLPQHEQFFYYVVIDIPT